MKQIWTTIWKEQLKILGQNTSQIFTIHLAYMVLGIVIFTPLLSITGKFMLGFSGETLLSDLDIAYFFLTPAGMVSSIFFATLLITIVVFEQASLMVLCLNVLLNKQMSVLPSLHFTLTRIKPIFLFALHLVIRVLLITLPFLFLAGLVAWNLISEYDINYYLTEKPPSFLIAATIIIILLLAMGFILVRKLLMWSFALPIILFSDTPPAKTFRKSETAIMGNIRTILIILGIMVLMAFALNMVIFTSLQYTCSFFSPLFIHSVSRLSVVIGGVITLMTITNVLLTALISGSFATLLVTVYIKSCPDIKPCKLPSTHQHRNKLITAPRCILVLIATTCISIFTGNQILKNIQAEDHTQVMAHRGAAGKAPENTIASIRQAIEDGTDWVEIDVQESLDGKVVVAHDSDFMKFAGNPMKVWNGTLSQIKDIDVGSWFSPEFAHERVPTLAEVLEVARGRSRVLIELKYYGYDQKLEERVVSIVENMDMVNNIAIMSLNHNGIRKIRTLRPDWPVGLLLTQSVGNIADLDVNFLGISQVAANPGFIRRIHSTGKDVYVWTVNDQVSMSRLISLGVEGLITDEPELAVSVLKQRSEMTPIEQLLIHGAVLLNQPIPKRIYRDQSP